MKSNNYLNIDYDKLNSLAEDRSFQYQKGTPFPHIVLDNFLSKSTYKHIVDTFPGSKSPIWKTPTNIHTVKKSVTKQGPFGLRESMFNENQRRLLMELSSSLFLNFLEKVSSINGLIPDPYYAEGGFMMSQSGGFLDEHADFSHHDKLGLERRLNVILYLNNEWEKDYGGALKLYDKDLNPVKSIYPNGNRLLIFTTSATSYHGFPEKVKSPDTIIRKSINLYYYTVPTKNRRIKRIIFPKDPDFNW